MTTLAPTQPRLARKTQRVFGIIRVSREKEDGKSPGEQLDRLRDTCQREGWDLAETVDELDMSGGAPLSRRHGLRRAVELVEAGDIDIICVAYFDRLVRSLRVQEEIVTRIEAVGGRILTIDFGEVSHKTPTKWLSATMIGMVNEYYRRSTAERTEASKAAAVARGVPPFSTLPVPLFKKPDGTIGINEEQARIVRQAFEMRADTPSATLQAIREMMQANGIRISHSQVGDLLRSRLMLGELRFGKYVNPDSHPAVVDASLWRRAQEAVIPRGRNAKSTRLLARQGILCCASCGSRLIVSHRTPTYATYRCHAALDCPRKVAIEATRVERYVEAEARRLLTAFHGRASLEAEEKAARAKVDSAQQELDAAVEAFSGLDGVASAKQKLVRLAAIVDEATAELEELLRASAPMLTVDVDAAFARGTLDERRRLIRLAIDQAFVSPGIGSVEERVRIVPRETFH